MNITTVRSIARNFLCSRLTFDGRSRRLAAILLAACAYFAWPAAAQSPDLPGAPANFETIRAGSLIIPMDQNLQPHGTTIFNLKAYGLANHLLQNNVPVKWAIRSGKAKDGIDITAANTTLLLPAAGARANRNFSGGPFIVDLPFVAQATTLINNFNGALAAADQVDVYRLNANTSIDIRYTLTFKPLIGVNVLDSRIHSTIFDQASFPNYVVADISTITSTKCLTLHTEPHNEESPAADVDLVRNFVLAGGNFLAQCAATEHFEETGTSRFQTTTGVTVNNINAAITSYPNPDLAYSQYDGVLNGSIGGSHTDWTVPGAFANSGHSHALNLSSGITRHAATQSKLISGVGGNAFYLGGHEYTGTTIGDINGRRMLLNAALVPANRPGCGLSFASVTGLVFNDANNNGVQNPGELGVPGVTVTITSSGGGGSVVVTTDANGNYAASIAPGTATVVVTPLPTYIVTTGNATQSFPAPSGAITTAARVGLFNGTRVTITKISQGGVGTFTFTGGNGWVSQNITTTSPGVGVSGATQILAASSVMTTLTESAPPAGFRLSAISCTGLGAGGTATQNLASRSVVLNAAATAPGSNIACTFTNARSPVLRLRKALPNGRFTTTDQFNLNIASTVSVASGTTTGVGTTANGTVVFNPGAIGAVYTFSETGASGANLANYSTTYACTNALAGGQTPSGSGASFNVTAAVGDDLTCTFTNTRNPITDLRLTKTNTPGVNGEVDQAADTVTSGATSNYSLTVSNLGPDAANGAVLADPAPTGLTCTTASCTAAGGAACPAATGAALVTALQGAGVAIPTLPNGGSVTVVLSCTVN